MASSEPDPDDARTIPVFEEAPVSAQRTIEPGTPRPEHAAFVVLGVFVTIAVFLRGLGLL